VVDTPRLLEFVRELRATGGEWVFPFDLAADIVSVVRAQLAYQMTRGLALSARMREAQPVLRSLVGRAFRLAVEQPSGWEARLFAQVLQDEIEAAEPLRMQHDSGVALGEGERISDAEMPSWVVSSSTEATRLIDAMQSVAHATINRGFKDSDIAAIIAGARQIANYYRYAFEWAARPRRAHVPEIWRGVVRAQSALLDNFLRECRDFPARTNSQIEAALASADGPTVLHLTFDFRVDDTENVHRELRELRRRKGLPPE